MYFIPDVLINVENKQLKVKKTYILYFTHVKRQKMREIMQLSYNIYISYALPCLESYDMLKSSTKLRLYTYFNLLMSKTI